MKQREPTIISLLDFLDIIVKVERPKPKIDKWEYIKEKLYNNTGITVKRHKLTENKFKSYLQ